MKRKGAGARRYRDRHNLPVLGSRSDRTRKNVHAAMAEARRRNRVDAPISEVMRIGDELGTPFSRASARKYGRTAYDFDEHGRSHLRRRDRELRRMDIISDARGVELGRTIRGSADASKVGTWQNAVRWYLETGNDSKLRALSERDRTIDRGRTVLSADADALQDLADSDGLEGFREEAGS